MKIFLYGISDASQAYRVLRWRFIDTEQVGLPLIDQIKYQASILEAKCPSIEHVYAIDDRRGLYQDFRFAMKHNSVESWAIFKSILETEGLKVF